MFKKSFVSSDEKKKFKEQIISTLLKISDGEDIKSVAQKIINSKNVQYNYLKKITGSKNVLDPHFNSEPNRGLILGGYNFKVSVKIDPKLKPKNHQQDIVTLTPQKSRTKIDEFCSQMNYSPLDIISALRRLGLIREETHPELRESLDCRVKKSLSHLYNYISNQLANGYPTNEQYMSYKKKVYPLGYPLCSGCDKATQSLLNLSYFSVELKTSSSGKPHIIQQVSNSLEEVEDLHAEIDVQIARNENVRRHILEYGVDYIHAAPDTAIELEICFGSLGPLMLKICNGREEEGIEWMKSLLYTRAVNLGIKRLIEKPGWSQKLEKYLPITRSQFQKIKWLNEYNSFTNVSTPIIYDVDNVTFIPMLMERYIAARKKAPDQPSQAEIEGWIRIYTEVAKNLREDIVEFDVTYGEAAIYVAAAYLCANLDRVLEFYRMTLKSRKIPYEIGITNEYLGGIYRVLSIVAGLMTRTIKMKDGISEIAGLFKVVDTNYLMELIKMMIIFIKTVKHEQSLKQKDTPFIKAIINNGKLTMRTLYGDCDLSIDLEKFKPDKAFR